MPVCFKCLERLHSVDALLVHFIAKHSRESFDTYQCKEPNCFSNFKSWAQLRRHLRKYHKNPNRNYNEKPSIKKLQIAQSVVDNNFNDNDINQTDFSENDNFEKVETPSPKDFKEDIQSFLLQYLGKLYAAPHLPRSHVQFMVDETKTLLSRMSFVLVPTVLSALKRNTVDHNIIVNIKDILGVIDSCLDEFSSEHRRLKLFSETGCLIHPISHIIGYVMEDRKRQNEIIKEIVPMTATFIPLREVFEKFFSLPNVFDTCKKYMENLEGETDVLSNFIQGKLWKEKKDKHFKDKIVFPLFVYFDDLEVNNPLGSHKGLSKLGATYVTIPCIPPEYRSGLENIFLALLFHSLDRSKFGNTAIFSILVDEINFLQRTGITLNVSGSPTQVHFALGLILGDNLGLNSVLGFVESFKANYFCRFCKTHKSFTENDCVERPEMLRRIEEYPDDVWDSIENSGIKEESVWNNVDNFHVYQNYCSDPLLHEMAEGIGKRAMKHILYHYIHVVKAFSVQRLNQRLTTFNYNTCGISNKPPLISENEIAEKKLNMSGSEMINFIIIFGILMGDLLPSDEVWHFYLILRQILEIVSAKAVQPECVGLLKYLVSVYNALYVKLFREKLKPKEHIMLHWPMIMSMSGPLSLISSMRMEAKNRLFKIRSNATSSRRNIVHTTGFKEQLQFCFRLISQTGLVSKFEIGPASCTEDTDLECIQDFGPDISQEILRTCVDVPWVNIKGSIYKVGMCLTLKNNEQDLPVFGEIHKIFCSEEQIIYFLCCNQSIMAFDEHFHAFEVTESGLFSCYRHDDLLYSVPVIHTRNANGNRYMFMK